MYFGHFNLKSCGKDPSSTADDLLAVALAEQGNPVQNRNTADLIRGAVSTEPASFIAKASHWVKT